MRKVFAKEPKEPKKEPWSEKNPIRQQMKMDVAKNRITDDMTLEQAQALRAMYGSMKAEVFKSCLEGMKQIVAKAKERAASDHAAYLHDRQIRPKPACEKNGEPSWDGHEAKKLLAVDLEDDKLKKLSPKELWETRSQYKEFTLKTFRGHIYQAQHTEKFFNQWGNTKKDYPLVVNDKM